MMKLFKKTLFALVFLIKSILWTDFQEPIQVIANLNLSPSMINSIDFHPYKSLFCATFTQNNQIIFYQADDDGIWKISQVLKNPFSFLSSPQHAIFSNDGKCLVVANWCNQTFNVYSLNADGLYRSKPTAVIPYFLSLDNHNYRPHGIAFSKAYDYLAVAYGASKLEPRAVALYQVYHLASEHPEFKLLSLLHDEVIDQGIPKGIAFSPDDSCLLVTLASIDSIAVYTIDWPNDCIIPTRIISPPRQILQGVDTHLCRPEDIKFTNDGNFCAVSNSMDNTVTFYAFDKENNFFMQNEPSYTFDTGLTFPHGLAFSSDGKYFTVTQFGNVKFNLDGNLSSWAKEKKEAISIYKFK